MSNLDTDIPASYIRESFSADENGAIFWKERPASHFATSRSKTRRNTQAGQAAGRMAKNGYYIVSISYKGKIYQLSAHRIVWLLHTGSWPKHQIDHINRVRHDNRLSNLRDVTQDENARNNGKNGTGLIGAYRMKGSSRFRSQIRDGAKNIGLGCYATAQEASSVYLQALHQRRAHLGEKT